MTPIRTVVLLAAMVAMLPAGAHAQGNLSSHDTPPPPAAGLLGTRIVAPALSRFSTAVGPLCIVLPEEMLTTRRNVVIGVVEGTVPPAELEAVLAAGGALDAARALTRSLVGVGTRPARGQNAEVIRHFNALVRGSSAEFMADPPHEFLAVYEIVNYQSTGAPPASVWVCPADEVVEPPPVITPPEERALEICVLVDDDLRIVTGIFRPETGDTLINNVPFREAYPLLAPTYASVAPWFVQSDSMRFNQQLYVRFGLTRRMAPENLERVGDHQGTAIFAEIGEEVPHPALLVPVRPGCVFQPYQRRETIRPRG
jgi:hypothetical protein